MELKKFIKETLQQIVQGVQEAQESVQNSGAVINPSTVWNTSLMTVKIHDKPRLVQIIDFEIGLVSDGEKGKSKKISVALQYLGIGAEENKIKKYP